MSFPGSNEDSDKCNIPDKVLFPVNVEKDGSAMVRTLDENSDNDVVQDQWVHIAGKNTESDSRPPVRPIGPKRAKSSAVDQHTQRKRLCKESNRNGDSINAQMIQTLDPNLSPDEVSAVLYDYNHALRILRQQNHSKIDSQNPSLEYMIDLIKDWQPKSEIICMYVRWSKRLRRNFHLDSISTLLCVAKQCDYTPYVFLKNIKTLTISRSSTTYGLNFKFDTSNNKAIDGKKLNDKFLGLSITLRLLQRAVVSSPGTLGSIGLKTPKTRKKDNDIYISAPTNNGEKYIVADKPTSRFHTTGGLLGRIWLAIQHRWISLQIVEMLFPLQLAQANSEEESLAYSFQMHSSAGPTRYDFLDPLVGVCLRFHSTAILDNHSNMLQTVWADPSSFVAFGNRFLQSTLEKDRIQRIVETFHYLQNAMQNWKNITLHKKTERQLKWHMIRGYAFHFWLDRSKNQELKASVDRLCTKSPGISHKKRSQPTQLVSPQHDQQLNGLLASRSISTTKLVTMTNPIDPTISRTSPGVSDGSSSDATGKTLSSGLSPLLTTRQVTLPERPPMPRSEPQQEQQFSKSLISETPHSNASNEHMCFEWTSIRLATQAEITSRVSSHLLIHRDDGVTLVAELSPLEVYSADVLYKHRHSRRTREHGHFPKSEIGSVFLSIGADAQKFIDQSSKSFHVAREDSTYFKEHGDLLPSMLKLTDLCKAVLKYGNSDPTRSPHQFRVNIGCGGQHRPNGKPEALIGMNFKKKLSTDPDFNEEEVIATIGQMTEFTWNILQDMQVEANDGPLAPDHARQQHYARHLTKYLGTNKDVGFEDITVVVGVLYPVMPSVAEHVDCMNDSVAGYSRTGALNVVLTMGPESNVILLHIQVICNFRRVIREYLFPFRSLLSSIVVHCKQYLAKWQSNINQLYGGKTHEVPSPFDRKHFFLDDCLPFETMVISNGAANMQVITGEYLLTEIGPSRVLSFSMFIDPIVDLEDTLCFDQRIELCFVASLLSNPFWFEYVLSQLTQKHFDPNNLFSFGLHPLNDWTNETVSLFGAWQGGPHNRWSPCGGSTPFPNLFGAHAGATQQEQKIGQLRLENVVQVLYHHLQWVNSLDESVSEVVRDLPISMVEGHMTSVTGAIYKIVPCQFSVFRLMVFTTIAAGCGLTKQGIHLKALMYPVKGSASFKHLMNPTPDRMTRMHAMALCRQQAQVPNIYQPEQEGVESQDHHDDSHEQEGIESQRHDQLMLYLSNELGMNTYLRDETECILCESHPNRNLQCRDWFKKGRRIYDLDIEGNVLKREYGMDTQWTVTEPSAVLKFAFLKEIVVYHEQDDNLKQYVTAFGESLRQNNDRFKFCGRGTRTSDFIQEYHNNQYMPQTQDPFPAIRFRAANLFNGKYVREMNIDTIQVLGDGELPAKLDNECNDIMAYPDGLRLWTHVINILYGSTNHHGMYSARYHQHQEDSDVASRIIIFPGHLDKVFVERAIFVPLSQREFFTILAIPKSWFVKQNEDAHRRIQDWMGSIPVEARDMVHSFFHKFLMKARISMKMFDVDVRIFFNSAGNMLAFPANLCFHTTLIPGNISNSKNPRDLFIVHTTATTKR